MRRSSRRGVRGTDVRRDAQAILTRMGEAAAELAVSLVGDAEIHQLNREYRHKDRPTDVLAFAMREGEALGEQPNVLGDVVISLETAARQATERGRTLSQEVRVLLVHGILHLLGYDHEKNVKEARRMQSMERRLLRHLEAQ